MDQKSLMLDAAEKLAALSETLKALAGQRSRLRRSEGFLPTRAEPVIPLRCALLSRSMEQTVSAKSIRISMLRSFRKRRCSDGKTCHSPAVRITPMAELHAVRKTGAGVR